MRILQGGPGVAPVEKVRRQWLFSMGHSLLIISRCDSSVQFQGFGVDARL